MKRLSITSLLSTATLILATVAIVSCTPGSDNKPHGKKELTTTIKVEASDDLIAASDIEITYKGKGGIDVTDTITSTRWQKKIVNGGLIVLYLMGQAIYHQPACTPNFFVHHHASLPFLYQPRVALYSLFYPLWLYANVALRDG